MSDMTSSVQSFDEKDHILLSSITYFLVFLCLSLRQTLSLDYIPLYFSYLYLDYM
jgi:hypothetical protein